MGLQTLRDENTRFPGHFDQPHAGRISLSAFLMHFCTLENVSLLEVKKGSKQWSNSCIVNSWRTGLKSHASFHFAQHFVHRSSVERDEWINCTSEFHTQEPKGSCHLVTQSNNHHRTWGWQLWPGLVRSYSGCLDCLWSHLYSTSYIWFLFLKGWAMMKLNFESFIILSPHPTWPLSPRPCLNTVIPPGLIWIHLEACG